MSYFEEETLHLFIFPCSLLRVCPSIRPSVLPPALPLPSFLPSVHPSQMQMVHESPSLSRGWGRSTDPASRSPPAGTFSPAWGVSGKEQAALLRRHEGDLTSPRHPISAARTLKGEGQFGLSQQFKGFNKHLLLLLFSLLGHLYVRDCFVIYP